MCCVYVHQLNAALYFTWELNVDLLLKIREENYHPFALLRNEPFACAKVENWKPYFCGKVSKSAEICSTPDGSLTIVKHTYLTASHSLCFIFAPVWIF